MEGSIGCDGCATGESGVECEDVCAGEAHVGNGWAAHVGAAAGETGMGTGNAWAAGEAGWKVCGAPVARCAGLSVSRLTSGDAAARPSALMSMSATSGAASMSDPPLPVEPCEPCALSGGCFTGVITTRGGGADERFGRGGAVADALLTHIAPGADARAGGAGHFCAELNG